MNTQYRRIYLEKLYILIILLIFFQRIREGNLRLYVPNVDVVASSLKSSGFRDVKPENDEEYSLSMRIFNIWELHIKIYKDGFIDSHVEVSKDYMDVNYPTIPSIYEAFNFYRVAYDKLHIFDNIKKKWIKGVRTHYLVTLYPPKSIGVWNPITVTVASFSVVGILGYFLSRLDKGYE